MSAPAQANLAEILRTVAARAGVSLGALQGPGNGGHGPIDQARQRAVFIARRLRPHLSLRQIGASLGGRDAATVISAYSAGERRYHSDAAEETAVWNVLAALGVTSLPAFDPHARKRIRLEREISVAADRLQRLRRRCAEMAPEVAANPMGSAR